MSPVIHFCLEIHIIRCKAHLIFFECHIVVFTSCSNNVIIRRVSGHFVALVEVGMLLIKCNPGACFLKVPENFRPRKAVC